MPKRNRRRGREVRFFPLVLGIVCGPPDELNVLGLHGQSFYPSVSWRASSPDISADSRLYASEPSLSLCFCGRIDYDYGMRIAETVSLPVLQAHEKANVANVELGGYGLAIHSPLDEFAIYRATLDASDIDRLFLLAEFSAHTEGRSGQLRDIRPEFARSPNASLALGRNIDLRSEPTRAIVIVTIDAETAPLTIIDGNHRAVAQFLRFGGIGDVPAFVCMHHRVGRWSFIPHLARDSAH